MQTERLTVESPSEPFPIYADPTGHLLRAHVEDTADRDAAVAHVLGVLSGYAYSDTATVAMMAGRLGMAGSACVRISQAVDAMTIFSTGVPSAEPLRTRRHPLLPGHGAGEPRQLARRCRRRLPHDRRWGGRLAVHSGFDRNVSATRWPILELLQAAARGESIARPGARVDHPLEALYLAGHSLGGAMAVLFALRLAGSEDGRGPGRPIASDLYVRSAAHDGRAAARARSGDRTATLPARPCTRRRSVAAPRCVGRPRTLRTRVPLCERTLASSRSGGAALEFPRRLPIRAGHARAGQEARQIGIHDRGPRTASLHRRAPSGGKSHGVRRPGRRVMFRLAHISDLHVLSPEGVHWREMLFNKRVTGWANTRLRRGRVFRRRHLEAVLDAASRADHVVITGDVTNLALDGEYREAVRLLDRRAGTAEVTIVPGNHDLYLPSIRRERRFQHYLGPFVRSDLPELAVEVAAGAYPFVKLRGPAAIIGLSSAVPRPPFIAAGYLGHEQIAALKAVLAQPGSREDESR